MGDKKMLGLDFATGIPLLGLGSSTLTDGIKDVTGVSAAENAAKEQKKGISKQKQLEDAKLAEKDDEIARRRLRPGKGSLIATSPRGVQPLGG